MATDALEFNDIALLSRGVLVSVYFTLLYLGVICEYDRLLFLIVNF